MQTQYQGSQNNDITAASPNDQIEIASRSASPLIQRLPWYTDAVPCREDLLQVVRGNNQFVNFVKALRDFEVQILFSPKAEKGYDWRKYLHLKMIDGTPQPWQGVAGNTSDWVNSATILTAYRIVDIIELLSNHPTSSILIPRTRLAKVPPKHMLFENLQDWRSILDNFHRQVENLQIPPANSSSNKTLSLFKSALGHVRQSAIHRILSNFDTAAAHLSFFCQHRFAQGELPDLPSGVDLSQYLNSSLTHEEELFWSGPGVKQPLHLALFISPLYLFFPNLLTFKSIEKEALYSISVALGNQNRPPALVRVEKLIWRVLFDLADPSSASTSHTALKELATEISWSHLDDVSDVDLCWFISGIMPEDRSISTPPVASSFQRGVTPGLAYAPTFLNLPPSLSTPHPTASTFRSLFTTNQGLFSAMGGPQVPSFTPLPVFPPMPPIIPLRLTPSPQIEPTGNHPLVEEPLAHGPAVPPRKQPLDDPLSRPQSPLPLTSSPMSMFPPLPDLPSSRSPVSLKCSLPQFPPVPDSPSHPFTWAVSPRLNESDNDTIPTVDPSVIENNSCYHSNSKAIIEGPNEQEPQTDDEVMHDKVEKEGAPTLSKTSDLPRSSEEPEVHNPPAPANQSDSDIDDDMNDQFAKVKDVSGRTTPEADGLSSQLGDFNENADHETGLEIAMDDDTDDKPLISYLAKSSGLHLRSKEPESEDEDADAEGEIDDGTADILDQNMVDQLALDRDTPTSPLPTYEASTLPKVEIPSKAPRTSTRKRKTRAKADESDLSSSDEDGGRKKVKEAQHVTPSLPKRIKLSDYVENVGVAGSGSRQDPICIEIDPLSIWHLEEETIHTHNTNLKRIDDFPSVLLKKTSQTFKASTGTFGELKDICLQYHIENDLAAMEKILEGVTKNFIDGRPPIDRDPLTSVFHVVEVPNYRNLPPNKVSEVFPPQQMMDILSKGKVIIVKHAPNTNFDSFEAAIDEIASRDQTLQIQDLSIDIDCFPEDKQGGARLVSGNVQTMIDAAKSQDRILNALSLLAVRANSSTPWSLASCQMAWDNTSRTVFDASTPFPTAHVYWGLAATGGASTAWHKDACGLATVVHCTFGKKLWIVRKRDESDDSTLGHLLSASFNLESAQEGSEAILLDNTMTLIMPPGMLHAVYTPEPCVAEGCHFFATGTLLETLVSLIHTFICNDYITNTTHPETRVLLRRIQHFLHRGLVLEINMKQSEQKHLLDFGEKDGIVNSKIVFDFLAVCTLSFFAEALDSRSYVAPGQNPSSIPNSAEQHILDELDQNIIRPHERREMWIARGCARECMEWFNNHFDVQEDNKEKPVNLPALFLCRVAFSILRYKLIAEVNEVVADGNARFYTLRRQIESSLFMEKEIWNDWHSLTANDNVLIEGLEFCGKDKHQTGNWLNESLVPDHRSFKITRKILGTSQKNGHLRELVENGIGQQPQVTPTSHTEHFEQHGIRQRDWAYLKAKEEGRTISIPLH